MYEIKTYFVPLNIVNDATISGILVSDLGVLIRSNAFFASAVSRKASARCCSALAACSLADPMSAAHMPELTLPPGTRLLCYDHLMSAADADYVWPVIDENSASALCYTSGTTGRPKGCFYSHRSTIIHAYAVALPDVLDLRATGRILPVVPMFHVNAWGIPYAAALTGAALVLPGRHLDGASLASLLNEERVTLTCGVPTVWLGLLQHLRTSGSRRHGEAHHDRRLRRSAAADRGLPRRIRRACRARLGHERTQPGRHLPPAETGAGWPTRRRRLTIG